MTNIETPNVEFVLVGCPSSPIPLGLSSEGKKSGRGNIMNSSKEKCIRSCHKKILMEYNL